MTKVFNSDVNIDWAVIDVLKDKPMNMSINEVLTLLKFKNTMIKMTLHKAFDLHGVSPSMVYHQTQ